MANYNAPGVYVQDVVSGSRTISQASSTVGVMIGVTRSGVLNVAQKVRSWTEFISKYANGLDTPFLENSYLPYAVHGFFTNGGKELYVGSIKKNAVKATVTSTGGVTVTASTEGSWGNNITLKVKKSAEYTESNKVFEVTVSVGTSDSVTITDVTVGNLSTAITSNSKAKQWISEVSLADADSTTDLVEETITLAKGSDGDELTDTEYTDALEMISVLDDVTFVAIPGQTSKVVNDAILTYCESNGLFPFLDMPMGSTTEETKEYRKSISSFTGALLHPWGKVTDPLTNNLKAVPCSGHAMGVYARTIQNRGVHKAPAGVDAVVRGFVETEYALSPTQISTLNPVGVVCVTARPNVGIVLWGARSLNSNDNTMKYVTDGLLNLNIKKSLYTGTQFAVFEPNDTALWSKIQATCKAFLETLRLSGALKGSQKEAYFVTIDSTNNTDDSIAEGQLNIEIGYAPIKPAEFVIIKLAHSIEA